MKFLIMVCTLLAFVNVKSQSVKNFQLKDIENTTQSFDGLKGEKLTLIDFWASWCKPCMKAIPELNKIYETYMTKGVQVIGINCDGPRSISKVAPLSKSLQIKYPVLLDLDSEVMNDLNLLAFPTLILVNTEGKILWIHEGYVSGDAEIVISEIEKNLNVQ